MKYVFKELVRHKWCTFFSITGYIIATLFLVLILSIHQTQRQDSFGILRSTGSHFIAYIPTEENCCTSNKAEVSVVAEGVNSMMMDSYLLQTIKNVECVKVVEVADSRMQDEVITKVKSMMYKFNISTYNCYEPSYKVMAIIDKSSFGLVVLVIIFLVDFLQNLYSLMI